MEQEPLVSVVRGAPTDAEIAALVLGILAVRQFSEPARPRVSSWGRPAFDGTRPGPDAWRRSGLPA